MAKAANNTARKQASKLQEILQIKKLKRKQAMQDYEQIRKN